jgi:hypothetical protein
MSAIGPKRTSLVAPHMSAFGGKADITVFSGIGGTRRYDPANALPRCLLFAVVRSQIGPAAAAAKEIVQR